MGVLINDNRTADHLNQEGEDEHEYRSSDSCCYDEEFDIELQSHLEAMESTTPATSSMGNVDDDLVLRPRCAGCRLRISDHYVMTCGGSVDAVRHFHCDCLRCADCGVGLGENDGKCFYRNGNIYCKDDYKKLLGQHNPVEQCVRCRTPIPRDSFAVKVKTFVFHPECFRCATCDVIMQKGELFGIDGELTYCSNHFNLDQRKQQPPAPPPPPQQHPHHNQQQQQPLPMHQNPPPATMFYPTPPHFSPQGVGGFQPMPQQSFDPWYPSPGAPDFPMGMHGNVSGDFGGYENNNCETNESSTTKKRRGRKKRAKVDNFAAMNGFLDGGSYPPGALPPGLDPSGCSQGKAKRARTSFKHHQLRIMKAHFQINQNPDSRELKMLAQRTQLDKKVLQVWFQNARAKWRRSKASGESGSNGPTNSSNSLDQDNNNLMHHSSDEGGGMMHNRGAEVHSPSSSDCSGGGRGGGSMIPCC